MNPNRMLAAVALCVVCGCGRPSEEPKSPARQLPSYLLGTYERGARVENSVSVDGEDRAVRFEGGNRYRYRTGRAWDLEAYRLSVTESSVSFESGPLAGKQLALASVSSNCRIVLFDGDRMFRSDEVADCPMSGRSALTASACELLGTWRKTTRTGPLGDLLEVALTVDLQPDHFFMSSTSTVRCIAGDCRFDAPLPQVGTWSERDGAVVGPDLVGFEHVLPRECAQMSSVVAVSLPAVLDVTAVLPKPVDPPAARAYGRCTADEQCTGRCGDFGACTAACKYDVECAGPGEGMIASCRAGQCMATCATGNACPGGTICRDGLCL